MAKRLTQQGAVDLVNEFIGDNNYYSRLPQATLANVLDVQTDIASNPRMVNEFMETMFNKIVGTYFNMPVFNNPLKRFKRETEIYGDTIEEVFIGLANELLYDTDPKGSGKRLLSTEELEIQASYHKLNRVAQFKGTVLQKNMVKALTSADGLSRLLSGILNSLTTGNEINEYKYMKSLLDGAYKQGDLYLVEVGDITAEGNEFARKARQYALDVSFPHTFNAAGVENVSNIDNMTVFLSNETRATFDTQTLAGAFNMDKADLIGSQINVDKFDDDNLLAVMADNSFFVVQDKYPASMTSFFVADSLKTNYFLTVEQIISRSPYATAIAFVKEIPADMKYKLHVSKDSVILGDRVSGAKEEDQIDSQDILTKLIGFDTAKDVEDYEIVVEHGASTITETVVDEDGTITISLKDDVGAGQSETLTVVAKDSTATDDISHKATIRVQKTSRITIKD